MSQKVMPILVVCWIFAHATGLYAIECPKMPAQYNKDWLIDVDAAVVKIGKAQGANLNIKFKNVTNDLLKNLPNADKAYLTQMLVATYCTSIRDDESLSETEKSARWKIANDQFINAIYDKSGSKKKEGTERD